MKPLIKPDWERSKEFYTLFSYRLIQSLTGQSIPGELNLGTPMKASPPEIAYAIVYEHSLMQRVNRGSDRPILHKISQDSLECFFDFIENRSNEKRKVPISSEEIESSRVPRYQLLETFDGDGDLIVFVDLVEAYNPIISAIADGELELLPSGQVRLADAARWYANNGLFPKFLEKYRSTDSTSAVLAKYGQYQSPELRIAIWASAVVWGDWDPKNPEKSSSRYTRDQIRDWLQGNKLDGLPNCPSPVGPEAAKRIDAIIRPPEMKKGGLL